MINEHLNESIFRIITHYLNSRRLECLTDKLWSLQVYCIKCVCAVYFII